MKEGEPGLLPVLLADSFNPVVTLTEIAEKHDARSVCNLHGLGERIGSVSSASQVEGKTRAVFVERRNRQAVCDHHKIYGFNFRGEWGNPATLASTQIAYPLRPRTGEPFGLAHRSD